MGSGAIPSWKIDGETMETVREYFLCSKIIADGDLSHEIKRPLLLEGNTVTNLDSILKSRDITLPAKVRIVKSYSFSSSHVRMWELKHKEGWAPKNWCFWIVILEKTPESPLDSLEIKWVSSERNQPWIFTEGLMVKLKLQYHGHLMWRASSFEKTLMWGKIEGKRKRGWQRIRWLDSITDSMDMSLSKRQEIVEDSVL